MLHGEKLRKADLSISTSGDNTVISAPGAGKYISIDHIHFFPAAAVTVQMKDGATNYGGSYPLDSKQPVTLENVMQDQDGIITLSDNAAFVVNLSGAVAVTGFVRYRIHGS